MKSKKGNNNYKDNLIWNALFRMLLTFFVFLATIGALEAQNPLRPSEDRDPSGTHS